jgi:outer membrane scaffolding protein for murein synthesis (MipA/OmpV family)
MKRIIPLACAGAACLLPAVAFAAPPSERNLPLWELGVGGAALTTPAYPGADSRSSRVLGLPFLIYRGEVLRADQSGIAARVFDSDKLELDVGVSGALPASSDDVDERAGMPDLGPLVEFGPRLKWHFAKIDDTSEVRFDLPVRAVIELHGGVNHQGWTMEPRLIYEKRGEKGIWTFDAQVAAVFGDGRINRYFYEVQPQYATAERPAYAADAGLMLVRTGLFGTWRMNPDVRLFGFVRYESYAGAANRDSPLMRRSTGASAGIGFAWTLARSQARASTPE